MGFYFRQQGYSKALVRKSLMEVKRQTRSSVLFNEQHVNENPDRIIFPITYHKMNSNITNIVSRNFHILTEDPDTYTIYQNKPMAAFRRSRNLRDI